MLANRQMLRKADLSAKDNALTFTFTTTDYMDKEAAEKLKPYLRRPVVYVWKEGGYELQATSTMQSNTYCSSFYTCNLQLVTKNF